MPHLKETNENTTKCQWELIAFQAIPDEVKNKIGAFEDGDLLPENVENIANQLNVDQEEVISMNWHATGRFLEKILDNAVIVDFGSTTTDFICIKKYILQK